MNKENLIKIPFVIAVKEDRTYPPNYLNTQIIWDFTEKRAISTYERTYPSMERATCIGIDYSQMTVNLPFLEDRKEIAKNILKNNCSILNENYY